MTKRKTILESADAYKHFGMEEMEEINLKLVSCRLLFSELHKEADQVIDNEIRNNGGEITLAANELVIAKTNINHLDLVAKAASGDRLTGVQKCIVKHTLQNINEIISHAGPVLDTVAKCSNGEYANCKVMVCELLRDVLDFRPRPLIDIIDGGERGTRG